MHPMAGPWLSPNVVTVNSLPMVLPDMIVRCASGRCYAPSARRQLLAREQEYSAATALEFKPHEGQTAECPSHRALGVPHLDDQHPARPQMPAGLPQDDAYGIEPRATGRERHAWLVPVLRWQSGKLARAHVRRIGDDDIVGEAPERAEVIGLLQPHPAREALTAHIAARDFQGGIRNVDGVNPGSRQGLGAGDGDAARAGADIEHPPHAPRIDPRPEAALDRLGDRRA